MVEIHFVERGLAQNETPDPEKEEAVKLTYTFGNSGPIPAMLPELPDDCVDWLACFVKQNRRYWEDRHARRTKRLENQWMHRALSRARHTPGYGRKHREHCQRWDRLARWALSWLPNVRRHARRTKRAKRHAKRWLFKTLPGELDKRGIDTL